MLLYNVRAIVIIMIVITTFCSMHTLAARPLLLNSVRVTAVRLMATCWQRLELRITNLTFTYASTTAQTTQGCMQKVNSSENRCNNEERRQSI
jgi:hypothetical protein